MQELYRMGASMIGLNFYQQSPRTLNSGRQQIVDGNTRRVQQSASFVDSTLTKSDIANTAGIRSVQLHGDFSLKRATNSS